MLVRFVKNPPAAPADTLVCVRDDNSARTCELPRAGVLPLLAARFVVESALGRTDGWFGTLARDGEPDDTAAPARQSRVLATLLQAEQWGGASAPEAFRRKLAAACAEEGVDAPALPDERLAGLRAELRAFGALWRPLGAGRHHDARW